MCAFFEGSFKLSKVSYRVSHFSSTTDSHQRYEFRWLSGKFVGQLLVVRDEMSDVNVAVELLSENVLTNLISANQGQLCRLLRATGEKHR